MKKMYIIFLVMFMLEAMLFALVQFDYVTGNLSASAPKGIYLRSSEERGNYLTFCLSSEHANLGFYHKYCSPEKPDGTRIIKWIKEGSMADGYVVLGLHERSIDTKVLGKINRNQIQGFWTYLSLLSQGGRFESRT